MFFGGKSNGMTKKEFLKRMDEDKHYAPGWQAIDNAFEKLYPGQQPDHFATDFTARAALGGEEYLDGISVYTSPKGYKHLVTYGMTVLYANEKAFGGRWNGWGYEMTMKLKEPDAENCKWAAGLLLQLAKYTYRSKKIFAPNQSIRINGTPLGLGEDSVITSLLAVKDTEAETQRSVYGKTEFIQLVGITEPEIRAIAANKSNIKKLIAAMKADGNGDLVTDRKRIKSYL